MLDDFMIRASLAGIGVAIAAAPLGCFVVWRRMAYFGEATAHAALLGISLSLMFEFSVFAGALFVSLIMATLVTFGQGRSLFLDTLLGVAGHTSMAAGLIIVSYISGVRIELMAYLIGDILAVSKADVLLISDKKSIYHNQVKNMRKLLKSESKNVYFEVFKTKHGKWDVKVRRKVLEKIDSFFES